MNNNDDKLKNILKLKEELEKDLIKKGKIKNKSEQKSRKVQDLEQMKIIKEKIIKEANLAADKTLSIFDINSQDYDSSVMDVIKTLRKFLINEKSPEKRTLFLAILNILEGNFEKNKTLLENQNDVIFKYNYLLSRMYNREDVIKEIIQFVKNFPDSIYPYLLLLEYYLIEGNFSNFSKILSLTSKINNFFKIIYQVYTNTLEDVGIVKSVVMHKKFTELLLYIIKQKSLETENTKSYCLNVNYSKKEGTIPNPKEYCIKANFAQAAWSIVNNRKFDESKLKIFEKTPEYNLFYGFYYLNKQELENAKKYFEKFENQVENVSVKIIAKTTSYIGMRQFYQNIKSNIFKEERGKILEVINNYPLHDFIVEYFDPEIVRLLFAEKHCCIVYGGNKC